MLNCRLLSCRSISAILLFVVALCMGSGGAFGVGMGVIFGTDDRARVADTTTFPWSAIGQVQVIFGYQGYIGSGVMIGRYLALTCGHVAADPSMGAPTAVYFLPGRTSSIEPFGKVNVVEVIPAAKWSSSQDDGYDIAILVLDEPIGDQTGYFQIAVQPDSFFSGLAVRDAGYPSDKGGMDMYTVAGATSGVENNVVFHNLDTEDGQSGSPVWYQDSDTGQPRLVALNEGSYLTFTGGGYIERGIAAKINQSVANWIDEELVAHNDNSQDIGGADDGEDDQGDDGSDGYVYTSLCGEGVVPAGVLSVMGLAGCAFVRRRRGI